MSGFQFTRQALRCFRDDLEAARNCIDGAQVCLEGVAVEPFDKLDRQIDVMQDIAKRSRRALRRHK